MSSIKSRLIAKKQYAEIHGKSLKEVGYIARNPLMCKSGINITGGYIYADNVECLPFRIECDDASGKFRNVSCWYIDTFLNGLCIPFVMKFRKPHKLNDGSHIYYLAGIRFSEYDDVKIDDVSYESVEEAAMRADRMAEVNSEKMREDDEQFQLEQCIEQAKSDLHVQNRELLALIKELKTFNLPTHTKQLIKDTVLNGMKNRTLLFTQIGQ